MLEWLAEYDYLILPYLSQIMRGILIPFFTLGVVYTLGRMLELTNTDRSRNKVAFICILILSFLTGDFKNDIRNMLSFSYIFESLSFTFISVILYVNFCWKLFPRLDKLLDKRLGSDEEYEQQKKEAEENRVEAKKKRIAARLKKKKDKEKKK